MLLLFSLVLLAFGLPDAFCEDAIGTENQWAVLQKTADLFLAKMRGLPEDLRGDLPDAESLQRDFTLWLGYAWQCAAFTDRHFVAPRIGFDTHWSLQQWARAKVFALDALNEVRGLAFSSEARARVSAWLDGVLEPLLCRGEGCSCCVSPTESLCVRHAPVGSQVQWLAELRQSLDADLARIAGLAKSQRRGDAAALAKVLAAERFDDSPDVIFRHMAFLGQARVLGCVDQTEDDVFDQGRGINLREVHRGLDWTGPAYRGYTEALVSAARAHGFSESEVVELRAAMHRIEGEVLHNTRLLDDDEDARAAEGVEGAANEHDREVMRMRHQQLDVGAAAGDSLRAQNGLFRGGRQRPRFALRLAMTESSAGADAAIEAIGGVLMVAYVGEPDALAKDKGFQALMRREFATKGHQPNYEALAVYLEDTPMAGVERVVLVHDGQQCVATRDPEARVAAQQFGVPHHAWPAGDTCRTRCFELPVHAEAEAARLQIEVFGQTPHNHHHVILQLVDRVPPLIHFDYEGGPQQGVFDQEGTPVRAYEYVDDGVFEGFVQRSESNVGRVTFEQCGAATNAQKAVEGLCMRRCDKRCTELYRVEDPDRQAQCAAECSNRCKEIRSAADLNMEHL